jgi:hypothetical protein
MKRISILLTAALMMAAFSFTSCEKEEETSPLAETLTIDDEVASYFDEVLSEVDDVTISGTTAKSEEVYLVENSGTRTVETTFSGDTVIHTITFTDFVNGNSQFERVKNGTIVVKVLGRPFEETFWRQITFNDFTVNGNLVEGVKVIEKIGEYQFTISLTDGKITFTDETTYTRNFERTRTWVAGFETPFYVWDDEFEIEGTASGINRNEKVYTHTITNPLRIKRSCRWIVQGTIEMMVDEQLAVLDYGDGTCDRFATLTVDGETWTIRLRGGN